MKASKAYLAGLGTTGVLLASAIALLFLVGALVGFDAWPGGDLGERVERVEIRPGEEAIGVAEALPTGDTLPAAAGAIAVAAPPAAAAPGGDNGGTPPVLGDRESGGSPAAPAPAPGGGTVGGIAPPPVGGITGIDPSNPETARDVVADTTQQATQTLGGAVGTVSPEAGALVSGIGGGVADQIRSAPLKPAGP